MGSVNCNLYPTYCLYDSHLNIYVLTDGNFIYTGSDIRCLVIASLRTYFGLLLDTRVMISYVLMVSNANNLVHYYFSHNSHVIILPLWWTLGYSGSTMLKLFFMQRKREEAVPHRLGGACHHPLEEIGSLNIPKVMSLIWKLLF